MKKAMTVEQEAAGVAMKERLPDTREEHTRAGIPRRDFLKIAGFTVAAVAAGGCERPGDTKLFPHTRLHPEAIPGVSVWYTGVCAACSANCGILVRSRDNRPVKIEGLQDHPLSAGGLCAAGQAALLDLYDTQRVKGPSINTRTVSWEVFDEELRGALDDIRQRGGRVRFLTPTITSPSLKLAIDNFLATFSDGRHIMYDALSVSALLNAHAEAFGQRMLPRFRLDLARVIVSVDADFLGTWISPVEYSAAWAAGRSVEADASSMSWHLQVEAHLSLTGSKADERIILRNHERRHFLRRLEYHLAEFSGIVPPPSGDAAPPVDDARIKEVAARLWKHRGASLLLCGSNDIGMQRSALRINLLLSNYGRTLDITSPSLQKKGNDEDVFILRDELRRGDVDVLMTLGGNPAYDAPDHWNFPELLSKPPLTVRFATRQDESAQGVRYFCPVPHSLEDWSDSEAVRGVYALSQPAIPPLKTLRPVIDTLARWLGHETTAYDSIRDYWRKEVYPRSNAADFEAFWHDALLKGYVSIASERKPAIPAYASLVSMAETGDMPPPAEYEFLLHLRPGFPDSAAGSNAWLLELPDPIGKHAWDNVASISKRTAHTLNVNNGDVIRIGPAKHDAEAIELPVLVQEGMADGVVAAALGYGGLTTMRFATPHAAWAFGKGSTGSNGRVGVRVSGFLHDTGGLLHYDGIAVTIEKTSKRVDLAMAQEYQYLAVPGPDGDGSGEQRPCVQEITARQLLTGSIPRGQHHELYSLWPEHEYKGHHWGMTIDLNACTGCSACVVACQVENNIPVVGKDEVRRNRDMHWMRLDRYYFNGQDGALRVAHQPMLCHHCDNAPCETVCPVLATVHSEEGLNQQVYNRCVGTRYCSNNCPYKIRRFNWFDYARDEEENLLLNPDVTVRSRGVMEKCSFCVQRIQEAKIVAKGEQRQPVDGEIQPACMQSCPTRAITFGDMNDSASAVAKLMHAPRHYHVLEELGIKPSVGYLMQVRNSGTDVKEDDNG
jgi:Fe-S-cluster-containing dehydrogenase component